MSRLKTESLTEYLISRIGCPYVMGGTGAKCTTDYRAARMAQYPDSAANIRNNCQRLRGSASSCAGCTWADNGVGRRCYDCAQLTRYAFESIGINLVSGATSQWKKTACTLKGPIADMPANTICLVFRQKDKNTMAHVGVCMGDGTVIHAKGHASGVVHEPLSDLGMTHFLIPDGLYDDHPSEKINTELDLCIACLKEAIEHYNNWRNTK